MPRRPIAALKWCPASDDLHGYAGACLGVGQRMVVTHEVVTAAFGHGVELMVGQFAAERAPRSPARAVENVFGIMQPPYLERCAQAPLVERAVVRHQRQTLYQWRYLGPHLGKVGCGVGVSTRQSVDLGGPVRIVIRRGANQTIDLVRYPPAAHYHDAHAANARPFGIGRLEIYGRKIFHRIIISPKAVIMAVAESNPTVACLHACPTKVAPPADHTDCAADHETL